ncbi:type II secretion system F family protein [Cupriavidus agavae]|uniref:Tight adherence protein B n=1 Tax=Cupriavidus agavae TaxID=1001822 RepID=A0A4V2FED0_9BURK|nr:type II secretion system F family protein [Cupriavidus agavae]RZT29349.1 tight adherence protein B [Cupriavidus agavae]
MTALTSSASLLLAACALVLLGLGLLMLAGARGRAQAEHARAHLTAQTEQVRARYAVATEPVPAGSARDLRRRWTELLRRADLTPSRGVYLRWGMPPLALVVVGALAGGLVGAASMLVLAAALLVFMLSMRIRRIKDKMLRQLPGFLDGVVRLMTIGSSVPAAFQNAVANTEAPLRHCLVQAIHLQRAGKELDQAVSLVGRAYRIDELVIVASVLRLSQRYGGRADVVMERTATFMRDREEAQRELLALSAETRLSAWVLGLLPLVVAGGLFVMNAGYILLMWRDPSGRAMLIGAAALEIAGVLMLYRLAKSI